jgi:5-methylcytosine-specific restriction endonuclease McrA
MRECSLLPWDSVDGVCDYCGKALTGRQKRWCSTEHSDAFTREHLWSWAREEAKKRDGHRCVTCGSNASLEVNHINPRVGQGYGFGCWNHLENLETLCHDCHVKVTKEQRARRARRGQGVLNFGEAS